MIPERLSLRFVAEQSSLSSIDLKAILANVDPEPFGDDPLEVDAPPAHDAVCLSDPGQRPRSAPTHTNGPAG